MNSFKRLQTIDCTRNTITTQITTTILTIVTLSTATPLVLLAIIIITTVGVNHAKTHKC